MMTLQLEVGKTYRARNGDVVRIIRSKIGRYLKFICDDGYYYTIDGCCPGANDSRDLIEEAIPETFDPLARVISALDDAERAEAEAMERIRESLAELRAAVEAAQKAMRGEG